MALLRRSALLLLGLALMLSCMSGVAWSYYTTRGAMLPPTCPLPTSPLVIATSHTSFQSLHAYDDNTHCSWLIQAPVGQRILLTFNTFETESCCDFLNIYENPSMATYTCTDCSTAGCTCATPTAGGSSVNPPSYYSTSNSLLLVLTSDSSVSYDGFVATVVFEPASTSFATNPVCSGFTTCSNCLAVPNCGWCTTTAFDTTGGSCVETTGSGGSSDNCPSSSSSQGLYFTLTCPADLPTSASLCDAQTDCASCNAASPSCGWCSSSLGSSTSGGNCYASDALGSFYGSVGCVGGEAGLWFKGTCAVPTSAPASTTPLWVPTGLNGMPYSDRLSVLQPSCPPATAPLTISSSNTVFQTFHEYDNDVHCVWAIQAPAGHNILISVNMFELESNYDFVYLYDNYVSTTCTDCTSPGCTCAVPPTTGSGPASSSNWYQSSSNRLLIVMTTDGSSTYNGFVATVVFVANTVSFPNLPTCGGYTSCSQCLQVPGCGWCASTAYSTTGGSCVAVGPGDSSATCPDSLSDPGFLFTTMCPANLAPGANQCDQRTDCATCLAASSSCGWCASDIGSTSGTCYAGDSIGSLYGSFGCVGGQSDLWFKSCSAAGPTTTIGTTTPLYIPTGLSGMPYSYRTVALPPTCAPPAAPQVISTPYTDFQSLHGYDDNVQCAWTIQAPAGHRILITFNSFSTESCCDFVNIYESPATTTCTDCSTAGCTCAAHLSGSSVTPNWYYSTTDRLLVSLSSDGSVTYDGFVATVTFVPSTAVGAFPNPPNCPAYSSCSVCLQVPGCGWCTSTQYSTTGGSCVAMDAVGESSSCPNSDVDQGLLFTTTCPAGIGSSAIACAANSAQASCSACHAASTLCGWCSSGSTPTEGSCYAKDQVGSLYGSAACIGAAAGSWFTTTCPAGPATTAAPITTTTPLYIPSGLGGLPYSMRTSILGPACNAPNTPQLVSATNTAFQSRHDYDNDGQCAWIIQAPVGQRILLTFTAFSTESCCDFVNIYENPTFVNCTDCSSPGCTCAAHFSGSSISPNWYSSTTNRIVVSFVTDGSVTYEGFVATAVFVPATAVAFPNPPNCPAYSSCSVCLQVPGCGWCSSTQFGVTGGSCVPVDSGTTSSACPSSTSYSGYLSTFSCPSNAPPSASVCSQRATCASCTAASSTCGWCASTPGSVTSGGNCYAGDAFGSLYGSVGCIGGQSDLWYKTCSAAPVTTVAPGTNTPLYVPSGLGGLPYSYRLIKNQPACPPPSNPQVISTTNTVFQSYHEYNDGDQCVWVIQAPVGQRILLTANAFATESCCDFMYVYENPSTTTCTDCTSPGCNCAVPPASGSSLSPNWFSSTTNRVVIVLATDSSVTYEGFVITAVFVPSTAVGFPLSPNCPAYTSCSVCLQVPGCGWCASSPYSTTGGSCVAMDAVGESNSCPSFSQGSLFSTVCPASLPGTPNSCASAAAQVSCSACLAASSSCGWCSTGIGSGSCYAGDFTGSLYGSAACIGGASGSWYKSTCVAPPPSPPGPGPAPPGPGPAPSPPPGPGPFPPSPGPFPPSPSGGGTSGGGTSGGGTSGGSSSASSAGQAIVNGLVSALRKGVALPTSTCNPAAVAVPIIIIATLVCIGLAVSHKFAGGARGSGSALVQLPHLVNASPSARYSAYSLFFLSYITMLFVVIAMATMNWTVISTAATTVSYSPYWQDYSISIPTYGSAELCSAISDSNNLCHGSGIDSLDSTTKSTCTSLLATTVLGSFLIIVAFFTVILCAVFLFTEFLIKLPGPWFGLLLGLHLTEALLALLVFGIWSRNVQNSSSFSGTGASLGASFALMVVSFVTALGSCVSCFVLFRVFGGSVTAANYAPAPNSSEVSGTDYVLYGQDSGAPGNVRAHPVGGFVPPGGDADA